MMMAEAGMMGSPWPHDRGASEQLNLTGQPPITSTGKFQF
jgi:hypothetical protein